jgi:polysaccharide export outer membrane protein
MVNRSFHFRPLIVAIAVAAATCGATCVTAQAGESAPYVLAKAEAGPANAYRLDSGDKIRITVFGEKDLSGDFDVAADGTLALPLIGSVHAAGRTLRELEDVIETKLRDGYLLDPRVSAEVAAYRPFFIIGEVKSPGSYPYVSRMTVLKAVALGGGFTYRARTGKAYITRSSDPDRKERTVTPETIVMPGDVIRIPERFF